MASIFSRIIQGEIPCYKIAETRDYFAFLDISPLTRGHTLVVPKREVDQFFDLENDELSGIMHFSKRISAVLKETVSCSRVGVIVAGLEVPHAHVHLVPMRAEGDLSFSKERVNMSQKEFEALAAQISAKLA